MLNNMTSLFDFSGDCSGQRYSLCKSVIVLLRDFKVRCQDWSVLMECVQQMASTLATTHSPNKNLAGVVEPMAEFIFEILIKGGEFTDWEGFCKILRKWARHSVFVVDVWKSCMLELSEDLKNNGFTKGQEQWLHLLHVLGSPLKLGEKSQNRWTLALNALIEFIVNPAHLSPNGNLLLKFFFLTLSRLVRVGSLQSTQEIALQSLFELFIKTVSDELPQTYYIEHLCLIMHIGCKLPYLNHTILANAGDLLIYPELHCLIPSVIKILNQSNNLRLIFSIIGYANFYGDTELGNFEDLDFKYSQLRDTVSETLLSSFSKNGMTLTALYGVTTHIIEEVTCGKGKIGKLFEEAILENCQSKNDSVALTALQCLGILSDHTTQYSSRVMEFLMKTLQNVDLSRDGVIRGILNCAQKWLMAPPLTDNLCIRNFLEVLQDIENEVGDIGLLNDFENFTMFITLYFGCFPIKNCGPEVFQSMISDESLCGPSKKCSHFAFGSNVILTVPHNPSICHLVLRNPYGKFTLSSTLFKVFEPSTLSEEFDQVSKIIKKSKISMKSAPPPPQLPSTNLLGLLYDYLESEHSDIVIDREPKTPGDGMLKMMEEIELTESHYRKPKTKPKEKQNPEFNMARYFLAHTGLLNQLKPLEQSEQLDRAIGLLDRENPRQALKVGVTYVKPYQQLEKDILKNNSASDGFQTFVQALGKVVDIRTYCGNLGGLDSDGSNGEITVAYTDWEYDMIFHVVPLMPTDPNDEQQLLKKRHVGNDIVNIVWSDEYRDYRMDTILTHLNNVIIVIYPLDCKMYRIQIILKKIDIVFGPLQDGMVIPWEVLPMLVRETAIQANNMVRTSNKIKLEAKPQLRKGLIQEVIERFGNNDALEADVLSSLI